MIKQSESITNITEASIYITLTTYQRCLHLIIASTSLAVLPSSSLTSVGKCAERNTQAAGEVLGASTERGKYLVDGGIGRRGAGGEADILVDQRAEGAVTGGVLPSLAWNIKLINHQEGRSSISR